VITLPEDAALVAQVVLSRTESGGNRRESVTVFPGRGTLDEGVDTHEALFESYLQVHVALDKKTNSQELPPVIPPTLMDLVVGSKNSRFDAGSRWKAPVEFHISNDSTQGKS
jgi:hypothetical protein